MRIRVLSLAASLIVLLVVLVATHPSQKPVSSAIVDVSWPNCKTTPSQVFRSGVIGATGGLSFRPNPCLGEQTTWFMHYAVYINTGYPGNAHARRYQLSPRVCGRYDSACLAYNYGFNAAQYAMQQANLNNVHANLWWLDVETENSWSSSPIVNRQSLLGAVAAIIQSLPFETKVGVYSYHGQWDLLTGKWRNGLPAWSATGTTNRSSANKDCDEPSFTGGEKWLSQYTAGLDQSVACTPQFGHTITSVINLKTGF